MSSPVELVLQQVVGYDERGQRVVSDEYFIKLQYGFKRWLYSLTGKSQTVFLALAMHEADVSRGYLPLTVYDIVEQSKELSGRNKPTISLRGAQYAINFLVAHNFIVKVGVRGSDQAHRGAIMYRVSMYAWFGPGNVPPSRGSSTPGADARGIDGGMQNLHTSNDEGEHLRMQKSAAAMQMVTSGMQNPAEPLCKTPREGMQKDARGMQKPANHIIDIDVGTKLLVQNQKQQVRRQKAKPLDDDASKARAALNSFGIGGKNLSELARMVSCSIADDWAVCARHTEMPLGKYRGTCYNSLKSDPTAPPPCSPLELEEWRAEEKRDAERAAAAAEYMRKVAAGELEAEPLAVSPSAPARTKSTRSENGFVHTEPPILNPDPTYERALPIWNAVLCELQLQMTKATFDTWVKPTFALAFDAERATLVVGVRNAYAQQWLENRLYGMIERTLNHVLGKPAQLTFVLKTREDGT